MKLSITKYLTMIFLINPVTSIKKNVDVIFLKQLPSSLGKPNKYVNDIQNGRYSAGETNQPGHDIGEDNYPEEDKKFRRPVKHRLLIKRLIPHGLAPSKLEFDSKYKTFYRPLVRVHKRKSLPKVAKMLNIDRNSNGVNEYGIDVYDYYDSDEKVLKFAKDELNESPELFKVKGPREYLEGDEELLQPFIKNYKSPDKHSSVTNYKSSVKELTQLKLLQEIKTLLRNIESSSVKLNTYHDIVKTLDDGARLRSSHISGEYDNDDDLMAPGKYAALHNQDVPTEPPKPVKWIPHYAPWNFWTYKKTIYQDECPDGQAKIANLCIWLPPH